MTEAEWFDCNDCSRLLQYTWDKVSQRKLRLFACACCRQMKAELPEGCGYVLQVAERFAESLASTEELEQAEDSVRSPAVRTLGTAGAVLGTLWASTWNRAWAAANGAANASAEGGLFRGQADLLREIVGNPFRRPEVPAQWPPAVIALAEALAEGGDCHFALHDALLEAGQPELAQHFATGSHPKGCWALDLILSKDV
jgi:hypothetical protein